MSPNLKQSAHTRRHGSPGFTLVELLVSVAIFLTVITGVFALYSGAVETVKRGNNDMQRMADARVTLKKMEDDLKVAFTGREFGEPYQFYGRPEGFMFVGKLSDGKDGRVTYVINPNAATESFTSELVEPYADVLERVSTQVTEAVTNAAMATGLNALDAGALAIPIAQDAVATFRNIYPEPIDIDPNTARNEGIFEFPVNVTTYSLVRYEEPDVRDLDTFNLPPWTSGDVFAQWPIIDGGEPTQDSVYSQPETTGDELLYSFLVRGLGDLRYNGSSSGTDLRILKRDYFSQRSYSSTQQLYSVDANTVKMIVESRRREYWIRLLADDPSVVTADADVNPGAFGWSPRKWTNDPAVAEKPYLPEYVLTQRILNRATLLIPGSGDAFSYSFADPNGRTNTVALDGLRVPGIFRYGFDKSAFSETDTTASYLNTMERLASYMDFYNNPSPNSLQNLDVSLQAIQASGGNSPVYAGTPMVPRLPSLVQIRFWIVDEKVLPNAPDFRRLFTQLVEVPSGTNMSTTEQAALASQGTPQ